SPMVYQIARRYGLQSADARDLVQEVLAAVATAVQRFTVDPQRGRFRTWLFSVARNQTLNYIRQLQRGPDAVGGSDGWRRMSMLSTQDDETDAEFQGVFRKRAFDWAARRIRSSVSDSSWTAFTRTAIEGVSAQRVADELGLSVGAVYLAKSRVMARLRQLVQDVSPDDCWLIPGANSGDGK
ncbi:MAG: sigma-70 family RNA polymerase sigma factor, partial [Planctomycetota bacterium]